MLPHQIQVSSLYASASEVTPNPLWLTLPEGDHARGSKHSTGILSPNLTSNLE